MSSKAYVVTAILIVMMGWQAFSAESDTGTGMQTKVDFSYAFSTPHRMTVARPDSSDKTLLDVEPGVLRMVWSYENLLSLPFGAYQTPQANWSVKLQPQLNGQAFGKSTWTRAEGFLPVLSNTYEEVKGKMTLEVAGGATAALVKVTMENLGTENARFSLVCESQRGFFGYNPAFVDPVRPRDCLLAGWGTRADRIIVMAPGADSYSIKGAVILCPEWDVAPGQTRTGWLIRPYASYSAALDALRAQEWEKDYAAAIMEWKTLLGRAARVLVPDIGVVRAFYACLGDLYIMREPVPGGKIAASPGTDGYRAASAGETAIISIMLDALGLYEKSADSYSAFFDSQGEDGDWADPQGWGHLMWLVPGFKSWVAIEHYKFTKDRAYLEDVYPHMLASSRFNERMRARTRVLQDGQRPLTYGLMPPGMGDCGLKDGDNLYGVFLPHNFWSVYADSVTLEAAGILGKTADIPELTTIHDTALKDLIEALDTGAIQEQDYRWIPGVAGKTCGSRWGALNALMPCNILPPDHELITGTLRHLESKMSPGGLPLNTGWMPEGLWVAIALDNLAEAHLVRNEGDPAAALFYATLNHGTPLFTWCEERAPQPGAKETTGDRQHLWTPAAVVRALRDMLIMEDGETLHLARGADRSWLASGGTLGIEKGITYFGPVSYQMTFDAAPRTVNGKVLFHSGSPKTAVVHVRLPNGLKVSGVGTGCTASVLPDGSGIQWENPTGELAINVTVM